MLEVNRFTCRKFSFKFAVKLHRKRDRTIRLERKREECLQIDMKRVTILISKYIDREVDLLFNKRNSF